MRTYLFINKHTKAVITDQLFTDADEACEYADQLAMMLGERIIVAVVID